MANPWERDWLAQEEITQPATSGQSPWERDWGVAPLDDSAAAIAKPQKNAFGARMPTQDELVPVEGYEAPKPKSGDRDALTTTTDTLKSFAKGAGTLTKGIGWLANSKKLEEIGKSAEEYWASSQSDYLKEKIANVEQAEGFIGKLSAYIDNPAALGDAIVQSIPMMVPGMGAGAVGARAAGAIAYRLSLRAGATAEVAAAAAQKAALRTAIGTNIAGEGAISGGATGSDVEGFAKSKGATDEEARSMANEAAVKAGLWTAAGAALGAGVESRAMLGQMTDMGVKGFAKTVGKEAGEEMIQNPGENYAAYEQKVKLDPTQKFDLGGSIAEGMVTGGPMGAGFHVAGAIGSKMGAQRDPIDTTPVSPDAEISMADVVGGKPEPEQPQQAEIRTDSPDLQMQNRDRGTAASVVQMQSIANAPDFDRLNASPIADVGAPLVSVKDNVDEAIQPRDTGHGGEITLPDGAKVKFRYAVVDAGSILASHDVSGRANPDYGAPQSGRIVALTNGRVAGLQEAYARGTATAPGGYMDRLLQDGEQFGIAQEAITDKEAPVLVRLYDDAVNARPDIGRMSNAGGSMRMSAQEVARNDARILPDVGNIAVTESGDIDTPENQPFIRGFVQGIPESERAEVLDKTGRLSQVGLRRIRNAIIHRAYGESSVFGRLVESLDSGMANLSKALVRAAPKVAKVKELMAAGAARDMDITSTLVNAVSELENMRRDGISLAQFLAQARLLDNIPPELVEVLSFLDANLRAPNRISAFIEGYYQQVEALGDPRTADMFGAPEVSTGQMLTTAAQSAQQEAQDGLDEPGAIAGSGATGSEGIAADAGGTAGSEVAESVSGPDQPGAAVGEQPASPASSTEGASAGVEDGATGRADAAVDREGAAAEPDQPAGSVAVQRPVDGGRSDAGQSDGPAGKSVSGSREDKTARTDDRGEKAVAGTGQKIVEELKRAKKKKAAAPSAQTVTAPPKGEASPAEQATPLPESGANQPVVQPSQQPVAGEAPEQVRTQPAVSEKEQALADLGEGIDELVSLLGGKTNMLPEEESRIIPVMSKIFRAAAKLGYIEFKAAGRFVLEQIRAKSKEVADKLSIDNLQAGYVNIAKEIGGDKKAALAIESIDELMADEDSESANEFVIAPDGSIDFGEISADQARVMKRQAGKIRLERGAHNQDGTGYGLVHIEAKHGKQIRNAGFQSIEEFIAHVASDFGEIWQATGRQLLVAYRDDEQHMMYVQLEPARDESGDYYRVNTAFPVRQMDYPERHGFKEVWPAKDGSEPASSATGQQPAFAVDQDSKSRPADPNARGNAAGHIPTIAEHPIQGNIADAAHEAATSQKNDLPQPTTAQKDAGNYKKGHIRINGFDIAIENPDGSQRSNYDTEAVKALHAAAQHPDMLGISDQPARLIEAAAAQASLGDYHMARVRLNEAAVAAGKHVGMKDLDKQISRLAADTWVATMPPGVHYGYLKRTEGADGDQVDVFVGPNPESKVYWVINQRQPDDTAQPGDSTGTFDEHKVMLGFLRGDDAVAAYLKSFEGRFGSKVFMSSSPMKSIGELAAELPKLKKSRPVKAEKPEPARRALELKNDKIPSAASEAMGIALAPEHRQALYAALKGKDLSLTVRIEDTGETARLDMDAADALQKSDERVNSLTQLLDCVRG